MEPVRKESAGEEGSCCAGCWALLMLLLQLSSAQQNNHPAKLGWIVGRVLPSLLRCLLLQTASTPRSTSLTL